MRFSVIIPAHNPDLEQLGVCLSSILHQLDTSRHQVLIIDDFSDSPILPGCPGVKVHRTDSDMGGLAATNLGLSLSDGDLIHVIHPDDWVFQGFYRAISNYVAMKNVALYYTDYVNTSSQGIPFQSVPLATITPLGVKHPYKLHHGNPFAVAGCVVTRRFYEEHGGWHPDLYHTADWEFWIRAAVKGESIHVNPGMPLAAYRHHPTNHTHRLTPTAANLKNYIDCARVVETYAPELVNWQEFRRYVSGRASRQASDFLKAGNFDAARINMEFSTDVMRMAE